MNTEENNEEIVYEEDKGAELVKKLRKRLKDCEKDKKEYLNGWQRLKADTMNAKVSLLEREADIKEKSKADTLKSLFTILDSFDMAFNGASWEKVDQVWRTGVEQIHSQIVEILKDTYTPFGEIGEQFNPQKHEAIGNEDGGKSGTIAKVVRKGYTSKNGVERAAQVIVYN